MIEEVTMYRLVCDADGCNARPGGNGDYYAWSDKDGAVEEAAGCDWWHDEATGQWFCNDHEPRCSGCGGCLEAALEVVYADLDRLATATGLTRPEDVLWELVAALDRRDYHDAARAVELTAVVAARESRAATDENAADAAYWDGYNADHADRAGGNQSGGHATAAAVARGMGADQSGCADASHHSDYTRNATRPSTHHIGSHVECYDCGIASCPDCIAGKHRNCEGMPCACDCRTAHRRTEGNCHDHRPDHFRH